MSSKNANQKIFYNVVCTERSILGSPIIYEDFNLDDLCEVHKYILKKSKEHPTATWIIYPVYVNPISAL